MDHDLLSFEQCLQCRPPTPGVSTYHSWIDHNDGQFFRAIEWLMFFFQATIDFNGFSMVLTMLDHHH